MVAAALCEALCGEPEESEDPMLEATIVGPLLAGPLTVGPLTVGPPLLDPLRMGGGGALELGAEAATTVTITSRNR